MDINDNQQVNTFLKGMNTDVSDALIDSSQYRYAENLRLTTTGDNNTGDLHLISGSSLYTTIPGWDANHVLLNSCKIRDLNVFVIKNTSEWMIYVIRDSSDGGSVDKWCTLTGPASNITNNVSLVGRYEDEDHVYLYIADGKQQIRQFNICDHDVVDDQTSYHTHTDAEINSDLGCVMPKIKIGYELDSNGEQLPGNIRAGKVQYAYCLYEKYGAMTNMSPASNMLSVIKYDINDSNTVKNTKGYPSGKLASCSIRVVIDSLPENYNTRFNKLRVIRMSYVQNGQEPTLDIIYDDDIDPQSGYLYNQIDKGDSIRTTSVSDYYSSTNLQIAPRVIESKDGYLFAANIDYLSEDIDSSFDSSVGGGDHTDRVTYRLINSDTYVLNTPAYVQSSDGLYTLKQVPSLRRGEVYRFGVIFYDENGNKSAVKHIADIEIPWDDASISNLFNKSGNQFTGKSIGIEFTLTDSTGIGAWEIVRCIRKVENTKTITSGIFGLTMNAHKNSNIFAGSQFDINFNCGFLTTRDIEIHNRDDRSAGAQDTYDREKYIIRANSNRNLGFLASPEAVYTPDNVHDIIDTYQTNLVYKQWVEAVNEQGYVEPDPEYGQYFAIHDRSVNSVTQRPLCVTSQNGNLVFKMSGYELDGNSSGYWRSSSNRYYQNISGEDIFSTFNMIRPASGNFSNITNAAFAIDSTKNVDSPQPNMMMDEENHFIFQDDISVIREKSFMRWSMYTAAYGLTAYNDEEGVKDVFGYNPREVEGFGQSAKYRTISGTTGAGLLINTTVGGGFGSIPSVSGYTFPIVIASIEKPIKGYGSVDESVYISFGDYQVVGSGSNVQSVFDGDCYLREFEYNALHTFYTANYTCGVPLSAVVYCVPLETEVDLFGTFGYTYRNAIDQYHSESALMHPLYYNLQDHAFVIGQYRQSDDAYLYNTAYSAEATVTASSGEDSSSYRSDSGMYDVRIHASQLKINGETTDSWLRFKSLDYIDLDSRYGKITDMNLFKNKFICWQENGTSQISINERTMLKDTDNNQIILGSGDVLQRFDYISQIYGMKDSQFVKTQSDNALYWWDYDRAELLQYTGQNLTPLIKTKGVSNYIEENKSKLCDKPKLVFDNRYDELVAHVTDDSLVYNEALGVFISIYKIAFDAGHVYNDTIRLIKDGNVYNWNVNASNAKYGNINLLPKLNYVANKQNIYNKVFDIATFGGRFYGGDNLNSLQFAFDTPLKQHSTCTGAQMSNREYDFRLAIPRNNNSSYGDRMRGKTMQCELKSSSNSTDFSLQYIITKYRMSWS